MKKTLYLSKAALPVSFHTLILYGIVLWLISTQTNWPQWVWGALGTIYLLIFSAGIAIVVKGTYINPFKDIKHPDKSGEYLTFEEMVIEAKKEK